MLFASLLLATAPRVLIVGGGPTREYNQAAIESNVRYVTRSLPKGAALRTLFADGSRVSATVRYAPPGGGKERYRPPRIARIDGPARPARVRSEVARLAGGGASPALLYFTGHGSLDEDGGTGEFDLWGDTTLSVASLAASLRAFPRSTPVVAIMVQCHAGDFADLLFPGGDPTKRPLDSRFCGFFASIGERPAAGCTPEIDEAEYRDFTSYFVAALTGRNRTGKLVTGADYDKDGRVGMDEAFCWSMVHDDSIDTPVCTSDEFLRRVLSTPDADVFATPYPLVLSWASAAQRAAIAELAARLHLAGEDRLVTAYKRYAAIGDEEEDLDAVRGFRFLRLVKSAVLGHVMAKHPDAGLRRRYATLVKDESANPFRP